MPMDSVLEKDLIAYVDAHRDSLIATLRDLVRIPSENTPPTGAEGACQRYCEAALRAAGCATDLYTLDEVPGLTAHPLYFGGRDYTGRPNLAARRKGSGGGRSLILSGHIDTVPRGTLPWTRDPFSGDIEDGRLYGRGSNDMKAGIAVNLFVARAIHDLGLTLGGDLIVESVVDEEFGGVNGTLAGRLRGYVADAAVVSEPSFLRVCPAQRGGRIVHLTLEVPAEGILTGGMDGGIAAPLAWLLSRLPEFAGRRRASAPAHFAYSGVDSPVPVSVLKIHTGPWGNSEPLATAACCRIELYWQTMPGEEVETIDGQFDAWLEESVRARPELFPIAPKVEHPIRWLPGSSCEPGAALVEEFSRAAAAALGAAPAVTGLEGPCDMYVFHNFSMPAILWGPRGGNTHLADEYVDLDTVVDATKALLLFTCRWCNSEARS